MHRKIPTDAFDTYVAMGEGRSHRAVAEKFGVTRRAVAKRASREGWSDRLAKIEQKARERGDERLVDKIAEMQDRHLKTLKAVNARVLAGLKAFPLASGMEAVRAAEVLIKLERSILVSPETAERGRDEERYVSPTDARAELMALIERQREADEDQRRLEAAEADTVPDQAADDLGVETEGAQRRLVLVRKSRKA